MIEFLPIPTTVSGYLISILVVCITWIIIDKKRNSKLPPGPWTWPLFGNLSLFRGDVIDKLTELREKFGDVYRLRFGPKLVVVISGYDAMKEAFVKHGDVFSDRPHIFAIDRLGKSLGIVGTSGESWKEQRKFALNTLREFGLNRNIIQTNVQREIPHLMQCLETHVDQELDIHSIIQTTVANVICLIVFGKRFEYGDAQLADYMRRVDENLKVIGIVSPINLFPWTRYIPGDPSKFGRTIRNAELVRDFFRELVDDHRKSFNQDGEIDDFLDAYIAEIKRNQGKNTGFHDEQLLKVVADLFVAGIETTTTTLTWTILYFLHNPEVQTKVQTEIAEQIGISRIPCIEDKPKMPFTRATLMEVQRHADIAPTSIPHSVSHDVMFRNYVIPEGAIVLPNLHSVLHDKKLWGDPEAFRPSRFIDSSGNVDKPDYFIPFHFGRRVCLGESLAKSELFLLLTAMLQKFKFEVAEDGQLPTLKGILGLTRSPVEFKVTLRRAAT